jgi:hypothetical protein
MAVDLKISELTSGNLSNGSWLPVEENSSSNYRLNLYDSIQTGIKWKIGPSGGNIRVGVNALPSWSLFSDSIGIGDNAGRGFGGGGDNIYIGKNAGSGHTLGSYNTIIGSNACNLAGELNGVIAIGESVGQLGQMGDYSIVIGNGAKTSAYGDQNSIVIGYSAIGAGTDTVVIGNSSITETYLKGVVHADSIVTANVELNDTLTINGTLSFFTNSAIIYAGSTPPDGIVSASPGSIYMNWMGTPGRSLYIKESGVGSSGWFSVGVPASYITGTATTLTPNTNIYSQYSLTGVTGAITFANPIGNPTDGKRLTIRYLDTGVSKAITWGGAYRAIGVTLPSSTTASKVSYVQCIYNSVSSVWDVTSVQTQA